MAILKNSAKCDKCGVEIESTNRHDFRVHRCKPEDADWHFAVDGGKAYIRRVGTGFTDTSVFTENSDGE